VSGKNILQFLFLEEGGEFFWGEVSGGEILLLQSLVGGGELFFSFGFGCRCVVVCQSSGCGDGEEEEEDIHGVVLLL
jgi:hypothetical protein